MHRRRGAVKYADMKARTRLMPNLDLLLLPLEGVPGPGPPLSNVVVRRSHLVDYNGHNKWPVLTRECRSADELDGEIDRLIGELETIRSLAHKKYREHRGL